MNSDLPLVVSILPHSSSHIPNIMAVLNQVIILEH